MLEAIPVKTVSRYTVSFEKANFPLLGTVSKSFLQEVNEVKVIIIRNKQIRMGYILFWIKIVKIVQTAEIVFYSVLSKFNPIFRKFD